MGHLFHVLYHWLGTPQALPVISAFGLVGILLAYLFDRRRRKEARNATLTSLRVEVYERFLAYLWHRQDALFLRVHEVLLRYENGMNQPDMDELSLDTEHEEFLESIRFGLRASLRLNELVNILQELIREGGVACERLELMTSNESKQQFTLEEKQRAFDAVVKIPNSTIKPMAHIMDQIRAETARLMPKESRREKRENRKMGKQFDLEDADELSPFFRP
jgi:hypothetical protein